MFITKNAKKSFKNAKPHSKSAYALAIRYNFNVKSTEALERFQITYNIQFVKPSLHAAKSRRGNNRLRRLQQRTHLVVAEC